MTPLPVLPSVETDVVQRRRMKKLRKSLDSQLEGANRRALKAHAADCADVLMCTKRVCFKREPDKIVGEPYTVKR